MVRTEFEEFEFLEALLGGSSLGLGAGFLKARELRVDSLDNELLLAGAQTAFFFFTPNFGPRWEAP